MADGDAWTARLIFVDPTGKKEVVSTLDFRSREAVDKAVSAFTSHPEHKTSKIFRVENEEGEFVDFKGSDWRRHEVKKFFSGIG